MTPRGEAIAFRIWAYAAPRGWNCEYTEVAAELGLTLKAVIAVVRNKGWTGRLRSGSASLTDNQIYGASVDGSYSEGLRIASDIRAQLTGTDE